MIPCLKKLVGRWRRDETGVVAIMVALSLLPILGLTGIAIDFANVRNSRSVVATIADAAAVAAVSEMIVKPSTPWADQRQVSLSAAKREFEAHLSVQKLNAVLTVLNYDVQTNGSEVTVKICYEAYVKTSVIQFGALASLSFGGCSSAVSAPPVFVSIYALVDASSSMGIGASASDRTLMQSKLGCVFACHTSNWNSDPKCTYGNWWSANTKCAHKIGATTRFDVVRSALVKVADQAAGYAKISGQYQLAIYKFSNYMTRVQAVTTNMNDVKNSLLSMEPDAIGSGTNFSANMADFIKVLPMSGDGKSTLTPKVFVLILTDGIASNVYERPDCYWNSSSACKLNGNWTGDPRWMTETPNYNPGVFSQAFMSKYCTGIKSKGITVLTLETEFSSSGSSDGHMQQVDYRLRPTAHNELAKCASATNLAYSANLGPDVDKAIQSMFASVVQKARIVK